MQKKQKINTKKLVYLAMFSAIQIVISSFLTIETPILKFGFGFITYILVGMIFGPWIGGIYGVVTDFLSTILFPKWGAYFPGFGVSAFLGTFIYGLFLYKKPKKLWRIAISILLVTIFVDIGLNTYWLSLLNGKSMYLLLPIRATTDFMKAGIKIVVMPIMWKYIGVHIEKSILSELKHNKPIQV